MDMLPILLPINAPSRQTPRRAQNVSPFVLELLEERTFLSTTAATIAVPAHLGVNTSASVQKPSIVSSHAPVTRHAHLMAKKKKKHHKKKLTRDAMVPLLPKKWHARPHLIFSGLQPGDSGSASPSGLSPSQVRGAYGLGNYGSSPITFNGTQGDGTGQTIVIVDAYDYPNAMSDLNAFSANYGLPAFVSGAGTSAHPGFKKYGVTNGTGLTSTLPPSSHTWSVEEALDIEWAHVMAPMANIVLVEASDTGLGLYYGDLYGSDIPGAVAVSNSWSGDEFSTETQDDFVFTTSSGHIGGSATATGAGIAGGVSYLFATGDNGAYSYDAETTITPQYPASSPNVIAVGGTHLSVNGNSYSAETAWGNGTSSGTSGGAGGGVSTYESQPAYQSTAASGISKSKRVYPDLSLNADPNSGVPIYDSWDYGASTPWLLGTVGGTSLACPLAAGMVAVADQGRAIAGFGSLDGVTQTLPALYALPSTDLHDITSGSIGPSTTVPSYAATAGFDIATGLGSPNGSKFLRDMVSSTSDPAWLVSSGNARWYVSNHALNVTGPVTIISDPGTDEPVIYASGKASVVSFDPGATQTVHAGGLSLTSGATFTLTSLKSSTAHRVMVVGVTPTTTPPTFIVDSTSTLDLLDNVLIIQTQ